MLQAGWMQEAVGCLLWVLVLQRVVPVLQRLPMLLLLQRVVPVRLPRPLLGVMVAVEVLSTV